MANTSEQDIQKYTIDVQKLDSQIKRLADDNERLHKAQDKLNQDYKDGKISVGDYKKQSAELTKSIQANEAEAKKLSNAMKQASKEGSDSFKEMVDQVSGQFGEIGQNIKNLFTGPAGIVTGIVAAIGLIINKIKENLKEAVDQAKQLAEIGYGQQMARQQKSFEAYLNAYKSLIALKEQDYKTEEEKAEFEIKQNQILVKNLQDRLEAFRKEGQGTADIYDMSKDYLTVLTNIARLEKERDKEETSPTAAKLYTEQIERLKEVKAMYETIDSVRMDGDDRAYLRIQARMKDEQTAAAEKKKYTEEQSELEITLQNKIKDLKVLQISDEKKQKIAQIELERDRQIEALEKTYKTATDHNKVLIKRAEQGIKNVAALQIAAIKDGSKVSTQEIDKNIDKIKDFIKTYKKDFKFPDPNSATELKKLNNLLSEEGAIIEERNNKDKELIDNRNKQLDEYEQKYKSTISNINELESSATGDDYEALEGKRLEAQHEYENNRLVLTEETNKQIELNHEQSSARIKQIQKDTAVASMNAWSQALSGIGDIFTALSETEDENSKKSLKLQEMEIYMSMAAALATGIANAAEAGWPLMLASIPSTIAMLISDFAAVKKLKAQSGYSRGGLITGPGSGTSDSIQANVSNGEAVMTQRAVSMYAPLLSAINQSVGGNAINTAENNNSFAVQLASALAAQPNPVVSVKSIDDASNLYKKVQSVTKL